MDIKLTPPDERVRYQLKRMSALTESPNLIPSTQFDLVASLKKIHYKLHAGARAHNYNNNNNSKANLNNSEENTTPRVYNPEHTQNADTPGKKNPQNQFSDLL